MFFLLDVLKLFASLESLTNTFWVFSEGTECIENANTLKTNVTENDFFNITLQLFNSYKYLLDEKFHGLGNCTALCLNDNIIALRC